MPISEDEKNLLFLNRGKPMVGLIHKENKEIVFAPCIPQKVFLEINASGEATSGMFMEDSEDSFEAKKAINPSELELINFLLKQYHVPRLARVEHLIDEKSAHEFLFEQKCGSTRRSQWGGFALTLDALDQLTYQFASGAFNSPSSHKRIKGSKLSEELQNDVIRQTAALVAKPNVKRNTLNSGSEVNVICYETPPRKRTRPEDPKQTNQATISNLSFFSNNISVSDALAKENFKVSPPCLPSIYAPFLRTP